MSQCRANDGDDANIRAVADVVVDNEPEVGDVDDGDGLSRWTPTMFNSSFKKQGCKHKIQGIHDPATRHDILIIPN